MAADKPAGTAMSAVNKVKYKLPIRLGKMPARSAWAEGAEVKNAQPRRGAASIARRARSQSKNVSGAAKAAIDNDQNSRSRHKRRCLCITTPAVLASGGRRC